MRSGSERRLSVCLFYPNGRNAVYITPIAAVVCRAVCVERRLAFAIAVYRSRGKRRIVGADGDCRPFFRRTGVIDTLKRIAIIERIIFDACYTARDNDTRKRTAIIERILPDARYAVWNSDARQISAIVERIAPDTRSSRDNHRLKRLGYTIIIIVRRRRPKDITEKCVICSVFCCTYKWNCNTCKRIAVRECRTPDARHTARDDDTRKRTAIIERIVADTRYVVGNSYACKRSATVERIVADTRYVVGNGYACKRSAIFECVTADTRYAVRDDDTRKRTAIIERIISDSRHAVRDGNARKRTATPERTAGNHRRTLFDRICAAYRRFGIEEINSHVQHTVLPIGRIVIVRRIAEC